MIRYLYLGKGTPDVIFASIMYKKNDLYHYVSQFRLPERLSQNASFGNHSFTVVWCPILQDSSTALHHW